ncbi:MAG: integrase [Desulfuromonas sp.]|uniref:M24 family metallopeptidase n=1 Tax=Desulfuromonas sp. TaxID=892 RepID=UPI000CA8C180|nr:aminopeptidase P family protein [Desulfuromonas sp.]PLX85746.1 MAG: integrase [Desulfuromonas sp.]
MLKDKIALAANLLEACGLDAFVFLHPPNLRFLCGFTGSDGALVATRKTDAFLTDSRYTAQAQQQVSADDVRQYTAKADGILEFLRETGAGKVGFESDSLSYASVERFREKSGNTFEWVPVSRELLSLRGVKTSLEVESLVEAARLNAEAFEEVLPFIRPGAVERDIALELEFSLRRRGGEEKAFDFIVASGERGAMPHGVASNRVIRAGELVTVDFGTRFGGYHSDETVTVAVGDVSPRLREIYDVVLEAHDRAIAAVKPGVPLREIDDAARDFIVERGLGDYFGHGTGHGVGLEVHEYPTVSPRSDETAREGMVFTVEPGVYIPELGGVRIEDMVLVTAAGCRRLTRIPKDFRTLPV